MVASTRLAVDIDLQQAPLHARGADAGFLPLDEVAAGEEAMLDVVDAQGHRLPERDRAEVPRDPQAAPVRLVDGGGQLLVADARVGLEPVDALVRPVADDAPRVLGRPPPGTSATSPPRRIDTAP